MPKDDDFKKVKDEELAKRYRTEGNEKYKSRNFLGALESYNKSLCFSPVGSANIAIVYASE